MRPSRRRPPLRAVFELLGPQLKDFVAQLRSQSLAIESQPATIEPHRYAELVKLLQQSVALVWLLFAPAVPLFVSDLKEVFPIGVYALSADILAVLHNVAHFAIGCGKRWHGLSGLVGRPRSDHHGIGPAPASATASMALSGSIT